MKHTNPMREAIGDAVWVVIRRLIDWILQWLAS
jgi:hypothetical protein